ncbi:hypothetical protein PYCCODRAFT_1466603 [Trametes coccinea BRFM310]|uniref:Uncharacterized protein n=1 Tax=Trametes coccinea (strain BRFM310) TaxID=1353009 RepID=A0A1Y2IU05_TRAC3|nr:hypothetical protein PYCCODRAFT_1466603 [Trametes coccinea BRFM310]
MSAVTTAVRQQMQRIAAQWPADPFRPTVQLKTFMESLAEHPNLTPAAVRASQAIQNNEFMNKYALSQKMLHPPSYPQYYTRLIEAFDKSAQGIGRPWWKIFFNIN